MTYFDFCFHRSTTVPPLQIRLPKRKDRLPTMNFQRLCLLQGVHYRFLEIPLKRLSKIKIQKPWLAKRKVLQVPHLAKLLANNNSVKVWIILDLKKNNPLLKFFLQQSWKWFQGSFWGLGSHLPGPCDPLPWFWGKNQLLSENLLFSTPKKPNHVVSRNRGGFFSWETVPRFAFFAHVSLLILVNVVVWVIYAMLRRGGTKGKWLQPSQAQGEFAQKKARPCNKQLSKSTFEIWSFAFHWENWRNSTWFFVDKERV